MATQRVKAWLVGMVKIFCSNPAFDALGGVVAFRWLPVIEFDKSTEFVN